MAKSTEDSNRDLNEAARISAIADKYRIGVSKETKRAHIEEFIIWLYQEGYSLADETGLIPAYTVIGHLTEEFLREQDL